MSFGYTTINGQRVEAHVAAAFNQMNQAFYLAWGLWLVITSGTRTREEQAYLYNGWINRLPGFNLAAPPGYSNHEESGPSGPRSIDIADTGTDYGVSRRGTPRDKWMEANAHRWEFENEGYKFNPVEAWHKTWRGVLGGTAGQPSKPISEKVLREQQFLNAAFKLSLKEDGDKGPATTEAYKNYQRFLNDNGYSQQAIGELLVVDGDWGDKTQRVHEAYYPVWQAQEALKPPAFPLPAHQWFGPEAGGDNSISGWHSNPPGHPGLKQFQQRMKDRGWVLTVDGIYGPKGAATPQGETAEIVIAFQKEKGLKADGLIGPVTWDAAWTAPITAPTNPTPLPEPEPPVKPVPDLDGLVTPTAADFPSWIRYEEKFDQQWQGFSDPDFATWNAKLEAYYRVPYHPIESHTHWWNEPGKGGTHDGNVEYLNRTKDVGANYVTSAKRITLTMPLDQIALTTGQGNPRAWKSENDPNITVSADDWGYKTLAYLHYIVEVKNPRLRNEAIRLHKEVLPGTTSCSNIDTAKVRAIADMFHSGELDPATGLAPSKPVDPTPDPDPTPEPGTLGEQIAEAYRELGDLLEQLPENV